MFKLKILTLVLASLCLVQLTPPALTDALEAPEFGGNNASEYQPPTGNPQADTLTGLQPNNNTGLQPSPTNINPQNLIQGGGLRVSASPDKGATSTTSQPVPVVSPSKKNRPAWVIVGIFALIAAAYFIRHKRILKVGQPEPLVTEPPEISVKPKKPKHSSKKSTRKKRQNAKR